MTLNFSKPVEEVRELMEDIREMGTYSIHKDPTYDFSVVP